MRPTLRQHLHGNPPSSDHAFLSSGSCVAVGPEISQWASRRRMGAPREVREAVVTRAGTRKRSSLVRPSKTGIGAFVLSPASAGLQHRRPGRHPHLWSQNEIVKNLTRTNIGDFD